MNRFLLIKDVSEKTFRSSEVSLSVGITYSWREKNLQLLDLYPYSRFSLL
jgi:hypothetical protein